MKFARLLPVLLTHIDGQGYGFTLGETYRPDEMVELYALRGIGSRKSLHPLRLAVDIHLFRLVKRDGAVVGAVFLKKTEDHAPIGAFWKSLDDGCRWGGDFATRSDGNHYSYAWEGRA
jgi:hypothetical protein